MAGFYTEMELWENGTIEAGYAALAEEMYLEAQWRMMEEAGL